MTGGDFFFSATEDKNEMSSISETGTELQNTDGKNILFKNTINIY